MAEKMISVTKARTELLELVRNADKLFDRYIVTLRGTPKEESSE